MKRWRPMMKAETPPGLARAIEDARARGEDVALLVARVPASDANVRTLAEGGKLEDVRPAPPIVWDLGDEIQILGAKWETACIAVVTDVQVDADGTFYTIEYDRAEE